MPNSQTRILVVDDEPGLLYSLIAFLEDEEYLADGASSGEEALFMLKQKSYDAVIVDIRLPGIDGNEVILKARESGCIAPFLIHTGSTDYQLTTSLKKLGFTQDDIFLKPLPNLNILCQALRKKLSTPPPSP